MGNTSRASAKNVGNFRQGEQALRPLIVSAFFILAMLPAFGAEQAARPPFEVAENHIDVDVNQDGSFLQSNEVAYRILDEQGLRALQQMTISYTAGYQSLQIAEAYTLKAGGKRVDVAPNNILYGRGASSMPGYQDIVTATIVFPNVEIGDEVVLKTVLHQLIPWIPKEFAAGMTYARNTVVKDASFAISVPQNYPLNVDAAGLDGGNVVSEGGKTRQTWSFHNDTAQPVEPGAVLNAGANPHVYVSSFADYAAVAHAADGWFKDKAAVTPEIRALADQLTAGITDPRAQAEKLYDWVSSHVSYVQIVLGAGGFVPHAASEVLANRFGDCKDHVMLLGALLAAKGIVSSPVLIGVGPSFDLPHAPTPYAFNHVITYIPQFKLFADSTAQFAPFGVLPGGDAGRPVILTATGEEMQTPALNDTDNRISVVEKIDISPDGNAVGDSTVSAQGAAAVDLRGLVTSISASAEPEYFTQMLGPGSEGSIQRGDPNTLTPNYSFTSHYTVNDVANFPGPGALPPWIGYKPFYITEFVAGSLPARRDLPYACPSITAEEDVTIDLPPGAKISSMPRSDTLSAPGVTLEISARMQKANEVREITTARIDHPEAICTADYYNSVHDSLKKMVAALKEQILYQ